MNEGNAPQVGTSDGAVTRYVDGLDPAVKDLQSAIDMIETKLTPIMTEATPPDEGSSTVEILPPVAQRLRSTTLDIRAQIMRLHALLERIEL